MANFNHEKMAKLTRPNRLIRFEILFSGFHFFLLLRSCVQSTAEHMPRIRLKARMKFPARLSCISWPGDAWRSVRTMLVRKVATATTPCPKKGTMKTARTAN
jgi:hypothetical protein